MKNRPLPASSGSTYRRLVLLAGVALLAPLATGCGSSTAGNADAGQEASGGGGKKPDAHTLTLSGDASVAPLVISPANPVLIVPAPGTTLKFTVAPKGSTTPVTATWSVAAPELGSIDGTGLFAASGLVAGSTTITASTSTGSASTTLTVKLQLSANVGMVSMATQQQLLAGGMSPPAPAPGPAIDAAAPPDAGELDASADPTIAATGFQWLYPYDGTVFPRGLAEPILQFSGPPADAVYVHISIPEVDYKGFFSTATTGDAGASDAGVPGQVDIGSSVWQALTASATASDSVSVELTEIKGGVVTGPITEHWTIAQGSLKGTVYYNSYSSRLFGTGGSSNGGVFRLKPGGSATPLIGGATRADCTVCHAVSANGSTLIATHPSSDDASSGYTAGTSYNLQADAGVLWQQPDSEFTFGGIYPDGTLLMTDGADPTANIPGQYGYGTSSYSHLLSTNGNTSIAAPGWDGVIQYALSPAFSADGTKIAFTHYDLHQDNHTIAVMDFALGTHTFSNLVDIATDPTNFLGWPTFTPDNAWVIFHADTRPDLATWSGDDANLVIGHLASGTTARLDVLNGFKNGVGYLPYGLDDLNHNYEPTVLPVAVGGYYWVVFTSRRNYGNTIEGMDPWGGGGSPRKKLWVAALDLTSSTSAHDISHPAFYLEGQELVAGNSRGFWALDPCAAVGSGCQSGADCCSGYCRATPDAGAGDATTSVPSPTLSCVAVGGGCSQEYEKCTTSADCCGAAQGFSCINSRCAAPSPK